MPEIIIREREDSTDNIKLNLNGNIRIIERMKPTKVTQAELDILMGSHQANFFVLSKSYNLFNNTVTILDIEEIDDTSSAIGTDINSRGDEAIPGQDSKLRGTSKSA